MRSSIFRNNKADIRAWVAFLLGIAVCVLAISYGEVRKEPAGVLTFAASSTQPGTLKVLVTRDGQITDPGWEVDFSQGNTSRIASFPLGAGKYELVGFKPLVETGGRVSIRNLRIEHGSESHAIDPGGFVAINQLNVIATQNGEAVIAPAQGANDPFGAIPNLHVIVPSVFVEPGALLQVAAGKLAMIAIFMAIMFGLSGSLPFARGDAAETRAELGLSQWIGFVAIGLIILYLRNAHSILVPVLYTEDGTWSAGLINHGFFDMLFNARPDYFVFGNILLLALAKALNSLFFGHNLTYLPHFVSLVSMLFYAMLAAAPLILLRGLLRIEARLLLWLFVLLVPLGNSSYEVLGRLSNVGFAFLFLTFCLLVWRHYSLDEGARGKIIATDFMLFLCANTNPICYPLIAGAFGIGAWIHWRSNNQRRLMLWLKEYLSFFKNRNFVLLLIALFLMGLWIESRKMGAHYTFLSGEMALSNIPEAIVARFILYPIIFPIYSHLNNASSGALLFIAIVALTLLTKNAHREIPTLVSAAVVLVLGAVMTIASRPGLTEVLHHYQIVVLDRYFFSMNLLGYLVIVSALAAGFRATKASLRRIASNIIAGSLVALYLGNSTYMFEFAKPRFGDLPKTTFLDEVKNAYEKGGEPGPDGWRYKVALHPVPWVIHFPAAYIEATVRGVRDVPAISAGVHLPRQVSEAAHRYDGKVIRQKPAGRGREDGWFYVSGGVRSWIPDGNWLKQKNLAPADAIEISHEKFAAIPDSGEPVK